MKLCDCLACSEGVKTPPRKLACGSVATFDHDSGISWRCQTCMAVIGSIAEPEICKFARIMFEKGDPA